MKLKSEYICDGCKHPLEDLMKKQRMINITSDDVAGFSVADHHNCEEHLVLCPNCFNEAKSQLVLEECWMDLDMMDEGTDIYIKYDELVEAINKRNK